MQDWRDRVRRHLPELQLSPERESEIVDELAQLLEDYAAEKGAPPAGVELDAWIRDQIPEWEGLARQIRRNELSPVRRSAPPATSRLLARGPTPRRGGIDMSALWNESRYALRMLGKNRGFTALAVLTLGLGIGLNTAVFSVVNAVVLRPLPVHEPAELVNIYSQVPDGFMPHEPMAYPDVEDLRGSGSLSRVAAYAFTPLILERGDDSRMTFGELVSGDYFDVLGLQPFQGRLLTPEDDRRGDPRPVVVLSHRSWQRRFGGDPEIIGKDLRLNGHRFTIVGIAPPEYLGLFRGMTPTLWLPMGMSPRIRVSGSVASGRRDSELDIIDDRGRRWAWVVARLAPGAGRDEADSELKVIASRLAAQYPDTNEGRAFAALPTTSIRILPGVDTALQVASMVVMAVVGLVLLIACGNLANMLLARALVRRKEIATRLSLGASRWQIVRLLLLESLALSLVGGGLGIGLALISNRFVDRLDLPIPVDLSLGLALDWRVLGFTLGLSTLTAVLFGLVPAFEAARPNLTEALHEDARGGSGSRRQRLLRHALVVGQVSLSLLLLICAGLSVRSLGNAHRIDPGFDAKDVVVATYTPSLQGYEPEATEQFYRSLRERLGGTPELESVGFASHLPLAFSINVDDVAPEGRDVGETSEWPDVDQAFVGAGYFETMRIPLLHGRAFTEQDDARSPAVAVINEELAERWWPGEDPIGKRLRREDDETYHTVIGVARTGKYRTLGEDPRPYLYLSTAQHAVNSQTLVARASGGSAAALRTVRDVTRELDPDIVISDLQPLEATLSSSLLLPRAGAALFGLFGLLGLILAAVGIYGVISYAVSQRTREIGIRIAMGAHRMNILTLVVRQGVWLTGLGLAIGLAAALAATRALSAILYGISATDGITFAGVSLFLSLVALLASYVPARRASRVDPLVALRYE